jgi:diacylglycerol kinase
MEANMNHSPFTIHHLAEWAQDLAALAAIILFVGAIAAWCTS